MIKVVKFKRIWTRIKEKRKNKARKHEIYSMKVCTFSRTREKKPKNCPFLSSTSTQIKQLISSRRPDNCCLQQELYSPLISETVHFCNYSEQITELISFLFPYKKTKLLIYQNILPHWKIPLILVFGFIWLHLELVLDFFFFLKETFSTTVGLSVLFCIGQYKPVFPLILCFLLSFLFTLCFQSATFYTKLFILKNVIDFSRWMLVPQIQTLGLRCIIGG